MSCFYADFLEPIITEPIESCITYLQSTSMLPCSLACLCCGLLMLMAPYKRNKDETAFRCMNKNCVS
ncbi:hypothetical protein GVAV_003237 [Gurleya vavrai]